MDYKKILDEILGENNYLCLATADKNGNPWASPLISVHDTSYNFYFISHTKAKHSKNIKKSGKVWISIFNSTQILWNAFWVQASGTARKIDESDVPLDIRKILYERTSMVVLSKEFAFYKIALDEVYLPHENRWKEDGNIRTAVQIKNLT